MSATFKIAALFALMFSSSSYADQGTTIMPGRQLNLNDINYSGQATSATHFSVRLKLSCFGTNLRYVANPLSNTSNIQLNLILSRKDGKKGSYSVNFPASLVTGSAPATEVTGANLVIRGVGTNGFDDTKKPETVPKVGYAGQTVVMNFPEAAPVGEKIYNLESQQHISFIQSGAAGGKYMGANGNLSGSVVSNFSADNSVLEIAAAFPGQTGFCGGYFSPLMVFFGSERPQLNSTTDFKLRAEGSKFYWPEGSKQWGFLAMDKNGNGTVDDGQELFGPQEKSVNGFESLAVLDTNKDGVIDKKDKEFKKLRIWVDLNGDGKTDKAELLKLSDKKIVSIPLKYSSNQLVPLGERGEFRERGEVRTSDGKSFEMIDVWFGVKEASGQVDAEKSAAKK